MNMKVYILWRGKHIKHEFTLLVTNLNLLISCTQPTLLVKIITDTTRCTHNEAYL